MEKDVEVRAPVDCEPRPGKAGKKERDCAGSDRPWAVETSLEGWISGEIAAEGGPGAVRVEAVVSSLGVLSLFQDCVYMTVYLFLMYKI